MDLLLGTERWALAAHLSHCYPVEPVRPAAPRQSTLTLDCILWTFYSRMSEGSEASDDRDEGRPPSSLRRERSASAGSSEPEKKRPKKTSSSSRSGRPGPHRKTPQDRCRELNGIISYEALQGYGGPVFSPVPHTTGSPLHLVGIDRPR